MSTSPCRLCFDFCEPAGKLFEEQPDQPALVHQIWELLHIKYEKSPLLPETICRKCLDRLNDVSQFHKYLKTRKEYLEIILTERSTQKENLSPGATIDESAMLPDENVDITVIDPNEEFDSSEEDFSMESDSDTEEMDHSPIELQQNQSKKKVLKSNNTDQERFTDSSIALDTSGFMEQTPIDLNPTTAFLCQYCDMAFTTQSGCAEHEKHHDPTTPFVCNFCPLRATTRQMLISHIKASHDGDRPHICSLCNKGFVRRSDLKKHSIVHTGVRPFRCPICSKGFSRNTNLTKHMRIHNSPKPHVCQRCPRSFITAQELAQHTRTHSDIQPFRCTRCQSTFSTNDKLMIHEQEHYQQDAVQFSNPNLQTLDASANASATAPSADNNHPVAEENHRHSILAAQLQQTKFTSPKQVNSKQFQCNICGKVCYRERDLQRHQALHLDKLFNCDKCGIGFNRQEKLTRHEQEHHGPQYPCSICHATLSSQDLLNTHLQMHQLQHNIALTTQAASRAASGASVSSSDVPPPLSTSTDMSFYNQMIPTMNLGFYSETKPEERNGFQQPPVE